MLLTSWLWNWSDRAAARRADSPRARRRLRRQEPRRWMAPLVEPLEQRLALTTISLNGPGDLVIESFGFANDELSIHADGPNNQFVISDPGQTLNTSISGATGSGTNQVFLPFSSVPNAQLLIVNTFDGNDVIRLSASNGFAFNLAPVLDTGEGFDAVELNAAVSVPTDGVNVMFLSEDIRLGGDITTAGGKITFQGSVLVTRDVSLLTDGATQDGDVEFLGQVESGAGPSTYTLINTPLNYEQARMQAGLDVPGGHLVTIRSATEQTDVQAVAGTNDVWIGASDGPIQETEGSWQWDSGPDFGVQFWSGDGTSGNSVNGEFSNWQSGEPDNLDGTNEGDAAFLRGADPAGVWLDGDVSVARAYVVEAPSLFSLSINAATGMVILNNSVGNFLPLRALSITAGQTQLFGGSVSTTRTQTYNTAVDLPSGPALLRAEEVNFNGGTASVTGSENLTLAPIKRDAPITVGSATDMGTASFDITDTDIAALAPGFMTVLIGDAPFDSGRPGGGGLSGGGGGLGGGGLGGGGGELGGSQFLSIGPVTVTSATFLSPVVISGGSISVTELNAGTNRVDLIANTDSITDGGDAGADITAAVLILDSITGLGTSANPLDTEVSAISASAFNSGGVFVANTGSLTIGPPNAQGGAIANNQMIAVSSTGSITVNQPIGSNGGDISLTAASGITINGVPVDTRGIDSAGGQFNADADSDNDGTGTFSISSFTDFVDWTSATQGVFADGTTVDISTTSLATATALVTIGDTRFSDGNIYTPAQAEGDVVETRFAGSGEAVFFSFSAPQFGLFLHFDGIQYQGTPFDPATDNPIDLYTFNLKPSKVSGDSTWNVEPITHSIQQLSGDEFADQDGTVGFAEGVDFLAFSRAADGVSPGNENVVNVQLGLFRAGILITGGGAVTVRAADVELDGFVNAESGLVRLIPSGTNRTVDLGATGGSGEFVLTDAELNRISTGSGIEIGNTSTGQITINEMVTRPASTNLSLTVANNQNIVFVGSNASLNVNGGNVSLTTGGTGAIRSGDGVDDIRAGGVTIVAGSGGIGLAGNPLALNADFLSSTTSGDADQFLREVNDLTIGTTGLNAGSGIITLDNGVFRLGGPNRIGDATTLSIGPSAALQLNGFDETLGGLFDSGSVFNGSTTASELTISGSGDSEFFGSLGGVTTNDNNFSLTKSGSGRFALSGVSTFLGTTTVNGGTLILNGSTTSATTVASGGTLGGNGMINGSVTVNNGGTLAPGNSPGVLQTGDLSFASGSTFAAEVNGPFPGELHDQIDVTGTVNLGGATLSATGTVTSQPGQTIVLIKNDGTDAISGTFAGLSEGATVTINGVDFVLSYRGGTGNDVTLTETGTLTFQGTRFDDSLEIREATIDGLDYLQIVLGGTLEEQRLSASVTDLSIFGDEGNDTLTIDYGGSGGFFNKLISFEGGDPTSGLGDSLVLTGGSFITVNHFLTNANDGSVEINGFMVVSYTGLEPITDDLSAMDRGFNFGVEAETITLTDAAGSAMTIDSPNSESVTFANPSRSLSINAGAGDDTVQITSVDADFRAALTINGGLGTDTVSIDTNLVLGSGSNTGSVSIISESIQLNANISTDAGTNAGPIGLVGAVQLGANVTLDSNSATGASGDISFGDTINGVSSLTTDSGSAATTFNGAVGEATALTDLDVTAGTINLNANIKTDGGTLTFTGNTVLGANVNIDTEQGDDSHAGAVTFNGGTLSANTAGFELTVNTRSFGSNQNGGAINLSTVNDEGGAFLKELFFLSDGGAEGTSGFVTLNGDIFLDDDGSGDEADFNVSAAQVVLASSVTIDLEQGGNGDTGFLDFGDAVISASGAGFDLTIDVRSGIGATFGGQVDLYGFDNAGGHFIRDFTVEAVGTDRHGVVVFNGTADYALATNGNATINAGAVDLLDSNLLLTGSGAITIEALRQIFVLNSQLIAENGDITLNANSAGTTSGNFAGFDASQATVRTTGTGSINLTGRSGNAANLQYGIVLKDSSLIEATGSGTIDLFGQSHGTVGPENDGILIASGSDILSDSGQIILRGIRGVGATSEGIGMTDSGITVSATSAPIFLLADVIHIGQTQPVISAGSGNVIFVRPITPGTAIGLGAASSSVFSLSDAQLDRLTADAIEIGDSDSGTITISDNITRPSATNLSLITGGNNSIVFSGSNATLDSNNGEVTLFLNPEGTGAITSGGALKDVRGIDVFLTSGLGGIGTDANPLITDASSLFVETSGNADAFLSEIDSLTINSDGLSAGTGTIVFANGLFRLSGAERLSNDSSLLVKNGAVFQLNGFNETVAAIAGDGSIINGTALAANLTVGGESSSTFAGVLGGATTNDKNFGLMKSGNGVLTLSGANTYTGATEVSGGTLLINGSVTSNVTVDSGATIGGTGTINNGNTLTVQSGGTVAPGNSPGILHTGDVSFASGATFAVEVNGDIPSELHDQLDVTGTVDLGGATLSATGTITTLPGQLIVLINNDGTDAIVGTFAGLAEGATVTINNVDFVLSYRGGTGNDVTLTESGTMNFLGSATDDAIELRQATISGSEYLQIVLGGVVVEQRLSASVTDLSIAGSDGNDTLTIDYGGNGGFFNKLVTFDGGDPTSGLGDSLVLTGGSFTTVTHVFTNASDGSVMIDGTTAVAYTGLEPITDNLDATDRVFNFMGDAEVITLSDAGTGTMTIDSTLAESVTFKNPTGSLTINDLGDAGDDTITISSVDAAFRASLFIDGGVGTDTITLNGPLNLSSATSGGHLEFNSETINLNANINTDGGLVLLRGDIVLGASVTIDTEQGSDGNAGLVQFSGSNVSTSSPNFDFTINTSTGGSNSSGAVTLGPFSDNGGGQHVRHLTITAANFGTGDAGVVTFTDDLTLAAGGNLAVDAQTIDLTFSSVALSGTGTLNFSASRNINVGESGIVTVVDGDLMMTANQGETSVAGTFTGIQIGGVAMLQTSGTGNIHLTGRGGDNGSGILVTGSTTIIRSTSTASDAGTITLEGTGGSGGRGVFVTQGATITSVNGDLTLIGTGGEDGTGIEVSSTAEISSTGTTNDAANITMSGIGGSGANFVVGVLIQENETKVTTVAGDIEITGTGGEVTSGFGEGVVVYAGATVSSTGTGLGAGTITLNGTGGGAVGSDENYGVDIDDSGATVTSVDGDISIVATGGIGSNSAAFILGYINADGALTSTGSADISINADSIRIATNGVLNAGANRVTIRPQTNGTEIELGDADAAGILGLTDAELDRITAGTLVLGDSNTGGITVVENIDLSNNVDALRLNGEFVIQSSSSSIRVNQLAAVSTGAIIDVLGNQIGTIAFDSQDRVFFNQTSAVTIDTVDGVNGVSSVGQAVIRVEDGLTIADTPATNDLDTAGGFFVEVYGSGGAFTLDAGARILDSFNDLSFLGADHMQIAGEILATNAEVELYSLNATGLDIGSTTDVAVGVFELSQAELNNITAKAIVVYTDTITVSSTTQIDNTSTLSLNGTDVTATAGGLVVSNLQMTATGAVTFTHADTNVETVMIRAGAGDIQFVDADGFTVDAIDVADGIFSNGGIEALDGQVMLTALTGNIVVADTNAAEDVSATTGIAIMLSGSGAQLTINSGANVSSTAGGVQIESDNTAVNGTIDAGSDAITFIGGTATLGSAERLSNTSPLVLNSSAALRLSGFNETLGSLTGNGTVTNGSASTATLTVNLVGNDTFSGVLGGATANDKNFGLTKSGNGVLTLSGANTYTGATEVSDGTLLINGSVTSNVTVESGATIGGIGTINSGNTLTVQDGGITAPGTSPGILNSGNVTLQSGSAFNVELNGTTVGTQYDQLNVIGTVTIATNVTLNTTLGFTPSPGNVFVIINNDGNDAINGTFNGLAQGALLTLGGEKFHIFYNHDGGDGNTNDVALIANRLPVVDNQSFSVNESGDNGTVVGTVAAADADSAVTFAITAGNTDNVFAISSSSGQITVNDATGLDFESHPTFNLTIEVTDDAGVTDTAIITIIVTNAAPSAPVDEDAAANSVSEGAVNGDPVGIDVNSTDAHGGAVTFTLTDDAGGRFTIHSTTGVVRVANASLLNFESATTHTIKVLASDGTDASTANFTIVVTNVAPSIPTDADGNPDQVSEGASDGDLVGIDVNSSDVHGGTVTFRLTDDAGGRFAIHPATGVVRVANALLIDFESAVSHTITVEATDGSDLSTANFTIAVTNVAPSVPVDSDPAPNAVAGEIANGVLVGIDADSSDVHGGTVTFSLSDDAGGRFAIDFTTGVVTVADASLFDMTGSTSYSITVQASDTRDSSTNSFTIQVGNAAPTAPLDVDDQANTVPEMTLRGSRVGITLFATDPDGQNVFYRLTDDAGGRFVVDPLTGVVMVHEGQLLRFAESTQHTIRAVAVDALGNASDEVAFDVRLTPVSETALPLASILPTRVSVVEGDAGPNFITFLVKLNKPSAETITVDFTTRTNADGGFQLPEGLDESVSFATDEPSLWDFFRSTGRLTFDPGVTEQPLRVQIRPDDRPEDNELFFVQILSPVNVQLAPQQSIAIAQILDDDLVPQLIIENSQALEGDSAGQNELVFSVRLVGDLPLGQSSATVDFLTGNIAIDTALSGTDYTSISGTLTFTDSDRVREVRVPILGDLTDETNETVSLRFENPVHLGLSRSEVVGAIINDDSPNVVVALTPQVIKIRENNDGSQQVEFLVTLIGKPTGPVSVNYTTTDETAFAGSDYTATSGTIEFTLADIATGNVQRSVFVTIIGDTVIEPDETLSLTLSLPAGSLPEVSLAPDRSSSRVVIRNDDQAILTEVGDALALALSNELIAILDGGPKNNPALIAALRQRALEIIRTQGLDKAIVLIIDPVDFVLTDPDGRQAGYTEGTGVVNEIPGTYYSGDGAVELLIVPLPPDGTYNVQLAGLGGDFNASITVLDRNGISTNIVSQTLSEGATSSVSFQVGGNFIPIGLGLAAAQAGGSSAVGVVGAFGQQEFRLALASAFEQAIVNTLQSDGQDAPSPGLMLWLSVSARVVRQQFFEPLWQSLGTPFGDWLSDGRLTPRSIPPELVDQFWSQLGQTLTGVPSGIYRLGDMLESLIPTLLPGRNRSMPRAGEQGQTNPAPGINGVPARRSSLERPRSAPTTPPAGGGQTPPSNSKATKDKSAQTPTTKKGEGQPVSTSHTRWLWFTFKDGKPNTPPSSNRRGA